MTGKQFFAALAGVFLLFGLLLFLQLDRMAALKDELQVLNDRVETAQRELDSLYRQQNSYERLDERIAKLEAAAKEAEETPLVDSYLLTVQDLDTAGRLLTLRLQAKLNVKKIGATAEVIVYQEGSSARFPLTEAAEDPGWYEGEAVLNLEDPAQSVYFQVCAADGGDRRAEELCRFPALTDCLDVFLESTKGSARYENGLLTFTGWEVHLRNAAGGSAYINVYLNGELSQALPITGEPMTFTQACAAGDKVVLRYTARDNWGLTYEFPGQWWKITDDGAERHFPSSSRPALVWP